MAQTDPRQNETDQTAEEKEWEQKEFEARRREAEQKEWEDKEYEAKRKQAEERDKNWQPPAYQENGGAQPPQLTPEEQERASVEEEAEKARQQAVRPEERGLKTGVLNLVRRNDIKSTSRAIGLLDLDIKKINKEAGQVAKKASKLKRRLLGIDGALLVLLIVEIFCWLLSLIVVGLFAIAPIRAARSALKVAKRLIKKKLKPETDKLARINEDLKQLQSQRKNLFMKLRALQTNILT